MTWADWNDEPVDWGCWLFAGLALVATAFVCCGCSSRPELELPADAGPRCADCWSSCGKAESRKAASFCALDCNRLCEEEAR